MNEASEAVTLVLTGQLPFILIISAVLAFPVSLFLLWLYRKSVIKSMQSRANPEQRIDNKTEDIEKPTTRAIPNLDITIIDSSSAKLEANSESEALYTEAAKSLWSNSKIYLLAGSCYSIVITLAVLVSSNIPIIPIRFLFLFITFIWPSILIIYLFNAVNKRSKILTIFIYFLTLLLVSILALLLSTDTGLSKTLLGWIIFNLPATVLILAFLNRRIKAVGPLVLTFMVLAIMGSVIAVSIIGLNESLLEFVAGIGFSFGLGAYGVLISIILIGFVVLGLIGWQVLKLLGKLYLNKKISDKTITADSLMLLFSIVQSIGLAFEGAIWILSGLVGFIFYKLITIISFNMRSNKKVINVRKLLLLRVFSLGKKSEVLFDKIEMYWRQIGTINMIAGPDLATTTIEPHEFLAFIGGKLSRSFIDSYKTFENRLSEVDLKPDPDGRFRVNEFFCFDDTWKMVLEGFVSNSDVVLMDLRGFSQNNDGCKHEIREIINLKPVSKILFIIDDTTDNDFLEKLIKEYWNHMRNDSPNLESATGQLQLFKYTQSNDNDIRQIFRILSSSSLSN